MTEIRKVNTELHEWMKQRNIEIRNNGNEVLEALEWYDTGICCKVIASDDYSYESLLDKLETIRVSE